MRGEEAGAVPDAVKPGVETSVGKGAGSRRQSTIGNVLANLDQPVSNISISFERRETPYASAPLGPSPPYSIEVANVMTD